MSGRDPFAQYRAAMAAVGFRPSSALGQNFLLDPSLHHWIALQAGATADDVVLEIGVGLGFLTRELAATAGVVVGIEIDRRLHGIAAAALADLDNVRLLLGDALGGAGRSMLPEAVAALVPPRPGGRILVVANLPYSVSGPLLAELCALPALPARALLLVQKELAARLAARCGDPDYGGLSAQVQALFAVRSLRDVSPQVFRPRPKVWSAILGLDLRADAAAALRAGPARRSFAAFVRALFQQRRKALRTTLPLAVAAVGGRLPDGLPPTLLAQRAETLGPTELCDLWQHCTAVGDAARALREP